MVQFENPEPPKDTAVSVSSAASNKPLIRYSENTVEFIASKPDKTMSAVSPTVAITASKRINPIKAVATTANCIKCTEEAYGLMVSYYIPVFSLTKHRCKLKKVIHALY